MSNSGFPSYAKGLMLFCKRGTSTPWELTRHVKVSFQGHILFKDPMTKPVKIAKVRSWYFENSHFSSFEKLKSPTTAPSPTVAMACMSRVCMAF